MPRISVLMSVYNTPEKFLREAIESILDQTYTDFNFVIIDDGSNPDVSNIVTSYQDSRIRYIWHENQGLAKSLNFGLDMIQTEFVARMDSDDIALPERFEKQVEYLDKHPEISILGTNFELYPEGRVITKVPYPTLEDCYKYCPVAHPTVMLRKQDLDKYQYRYDPAYRCEDYELWSRALTNLRFANMQEVLLKYRVHDQQLSRPSKEFQESVDKVRASILVKLR